MSSFDAVNYSLRPNKVIERKVVFSGLNRISQRIDLSNFAFIGFGSMWFTDFILAHKMLGMRSMISLEMPGHAATRAEFNRPYKCIKVIDMESTVAIPSLDLVDKRSVIWLDYDTSIMGPVLEDIRLLVQHCAPNSILIVTINAHKGSLPKKNSENKEISAEESLRAIAGDLVPTPLESKSLQASNYPKLLCRILRAAFKEAMVNVGRPETFIKLFDLTYADGPPMATIGGMLATSNVVADMQAIVESPTWEGLIDETIRVPPLTLKEKIALDRVLPSPTPPTEAQMKDIGFMLEAEQLVAYHRYYRYYPMFGEVAP